MVPNLDTAKSKTIARKEFVRRRAGAIGKTRHIPAKHYRKIQVGWRGLTVHEILVQLRVQRNW
jgi:hypothetical protein